MAAQSMLAWAFSVTPVICPWWENGESITTTGQPCYCLTLRLCEGSSLWLSPRSNVKPAFLPSRLDFARGSNQRFDTVWLPANNPLPAGLLESRCFGDLSCLRE